MFTLEQIAAAHAKVRTGADFPRYIKEINALGVDRYTTYVKDGHIDYESNNGHKKTSPAKYAVLMINPIPNLEKFRKHLFDHQQGKTNYPQFCELAAASGVLKWNVNLQKMTCTYTDVNEKEMLTEDIPS
ncbi:MAG: phage envelope protein [Citrobacter freundii]|nr:MAG: phage envelope protein [Citrobacter freundii]